MNKFAGVV